MFFYESPYSNNNSKKKQVDKFLLEQQAKSDALYPYNSNSVGPIGEGVWKGALATSILTKGHEYYHREKDPNFKMKLKPFLAYTALGGAAGGALKYIDNIKKVKQKKDALNYLYNNRPNSNYVKEKQKILKTASSNSLKQIATSNTPDQPMGQQLPKKVPQKQVLKDSTISGALGAGIGGLLSAVTLRRPGAFKKGAVTGAALGASNTAVGDETNNAMHDNKVKVPLAEQMAIGGALAGASEPLIHRLIGYGSKKFNDGEFAKSIIKPSVSKKEMEGAFNDKQGPFEDGFDVTKHHVENYNKASLGQKLKYNFIPNMFGKTKDFYDSDNVDMYRGMKGKLIDKPLLHHMAGKALWGGLLGYLPIKAVEMLQNHKKNKEFRN